VCKNPIECCCEEAANNRRNTEPRFSALASARPRRPCQPGRLWSDCAALCLVAERVLVIGALRDDR
jgi:hypothetical protein